MNGDDRTFKLRLQRGFDPVANLVAFTDAHIARHHQMEFQKSVPPGMTRTQIMRLNRARCLFGHNAPDAFHGGGRHGFIHQPADTFAQQLTPGEKDIHRRQGRQQRIQPQNASQRDQPNAHQHANRGHHIRP